MPLKEGKGGHGLQPYGADDGKFESTDGGASEGTPNIGIPLERKAADEVALSSVGEENSIGRISEKARRVLEDGFDQLEIFGILRKQMEVPSDVETKPISYYMDTDSSELTMAHMKAAVKKLKSYYEGRYKKGEMSYRLDWQFDDPRVEYAMIKWALKLQTQFPMFSGDPTDASAREIANGFDNPSLIVTNESPHSSGEMGCCYVASGKMNISKKFMNDKSYFAIVDRIKNTMDSGWWTKAEENDGIIAQVFCHEYGHAFFSRMMGRQMNATPRQDVPHTPKDIVEAIAVYAKTRNPDFNIATATSGYPRSYLKKNRDGELKFTEDFYDEWIAETFASMTCGVATEASDAMRLFIKEYYGL